MLMSSGDPSPQESAWMRRARPILGTLVEVVVPVGHEAALEAAFQVMVDVQRCMSRYEPHSDLSRCHAVPVGEAVALHPWTAEVLSVAAELHERSEGLFDVALGSGRWMLDRERDTTMLIRLDEGTRLDLGGIGKGWAVDHALQTALARGAPAACVNAGGDLRTQGVAVPVCLRDERVGGVYPWVQVEDGAMASSDFSAGARATLAGMRRAGHVSVAAPLCVWADALTKVLAVLGRVDHPLMLDLLRHYRAQAWIHDLPPSLS